MRVLALTAASLTIACAPVGGARYRHAMPPALHPAGPPVASARIRLGCAAFTWGETAIRVDQFRIPLDAPLGPPPRADRRVVGDVRSPDIALDADDRAALVCAWSIGHVAGCAIADADARGRHLIEGVLASLREQAAAAGAIEVRDVRCLVVTARGDRGTLWCEGVAFAGPDDPAWPAQAEPQFVARAVPMASRWQLAAAVGIASYGDAVVEGQACSLGYRGVDLGFHVVNTVDYRALGLGLELLGRRKLGHVLTLIGGASAMFLVGERPSGEAGNPLARGAFGPVLGLRAAPEVGFRCCGGFGVPFAELRLGWLGSRTSFGPDVPDLTGVNAALLLGFHTP